MIVAVDYDGTLELNGKLNMPLIASLRSAQRRGDTVILWTCREGERLREALVSLRIAGFRPNQVNANAPEAIRLLGHDPRKIYADIYIDDKGAPAWKSAKNPGQST